MKIMTISPRPTMTDIPARLIAEKMADDVMQHGPAVDRSEIIDDLEKALAHSTDGYRMARFLDDYCGWSIDLDLIESLESAGFVSYRLLQEATCKWVSEQGIKAKLKIGDKCLVSIFGADQEGEIVNVNEAEAKYTVFVSALGHVREGMGTRGIVLEFDRVENGMKDEVAAC